MPMPGDTWLSQTGWALWASGELNILYRLLQGVLSPTGQQSQSASVSHSTGPLPPLEVRP